MANPALTNLINVNISAGDGDTITAAEVRAVLAAFNSFIQDDVAYGAAIPFNKVVSKMAPHTITAPITFTKNTTGANAGCGTVLRLTADGTNEPNFDAFKKTSSSQNFDNTASALNVVLFFYDGVDYWYTIFQEAAGGTGGDITAPTLVSATVEDADPDVAVLTFNEAMTTTDTPALGSFSFSGSRTVTAAVWASATVLELTLSSPYISADSPTFNYTPGATPIRDFAGNNLAALSSQAVTNNVGLTQLNAVTSLTATPASATQIDLAWTDTNSSPNETGVKIYRNTVNNFGGASLLTTKAANATTHSDTGLTAATQYFYWVIAEGNGTSTSDSNSTAANATTSGSGLDADAEAYINRLIAAGYTPNGTVEGAIDDYVIGLKAGTLWAKVYDQGLFIGGTIQAAHFETLKDVVTQTEVADSSSYTNDGRIVTSGTQFLNIGVIASNLDIDDLHLGVYNRTPGTIANSTFDLGARGAAAYNNELAVVGNRFDTNSWFISCTVAAVSGASTITTTGFYLGSKIGTSLKLYKDNAVVDTSTSTNSGALPTQPIYMGGFNNNGTAAGQQVRNYCFWTAGDGLSDAEEAELYGLVQALQTALGRAV